MLTENKKNIGSALPSLNPTGFIVDYAFSNYNHDCHQKIKMKRTYAQPFFNNCLKYNIPFQLNSTTHYNRKHFPDIRTTGSVSRRLLAHGIGPRAQPIVIQHAGKPETDALPTQEPEIGFNKASELSGH